MGLTNSSVGINTYMIKKPSDAGEKTLALMGNPNVGKSTVFNALTGMNQHTGNWPGKTVATAWGLCKTGERSLLIVDLPGTYSLSARSAEEEAARDFICFERPDVVAVICDATCLERNFNLVLQTIEITKNVIVCVNLMDEAKRKKIKIDLAKLSDILGVPTVGIVAREKKSLAALLRAAEALISGKFAKRPLKVIYGEEIEAAVGLLEPALCKEGLRVSPRWLALKLLEKDGAVIDKIGSFWDTQISAEEILKAADTASRVLKDKGIDEDMLKDIVTRAVFSKAEEICLKTVTFEKPGYNERDRRIDRLVAGRKTGFPVMLILLAAVLWLSIEGANYPSQLLAGGLFWIEDRLSEAFFALGAPSWLHGALVLGVYRVLAWVISVMLPPMAIFFPLFTLLEDFGYLPRVAFNLDKYFKKCSACGKQALTM